MKRGLAGLALFGLLTGTACDITVRPFAGAIITMSLQGAKALPAGSHFELWARTRTDDIARINGTYLFEDKRLRQRPQSTLHPYGFVTRRAIDYNDPCLIDDKGNLITTAAAYPTEVTVAGVTQSPEEQAAQVRNRIGQVTARTNCDDAIPKNCGHESETGAGGDLFIVVPWDARNAQRPVLPFDTPAADRLAACRAYWAASEFAYTPNPAQLTDPLHGQVYGTLSFTTVTPVQGFDGLRIDTPVGLNGIRELFITLEDDTVEPLNRGPLFLQGYPDMSGNGTVHFTLRGSNASGTAALYVDLDNDPVQF